MAEQQYVALLRGINVGGNNLIKMTALKACLEKAGFQKVATYIQSGNVLFASADNDIDLLTQKMEEALSKEFAYKSRVVVVAHKRLREVVKQAPRGFGKKPGEYRYDVIFLKQPLTAVEALKTVKVKDGVDAAYKGKGVLYFSRLIRRATESQLSKIVGLPIYQNMTIRNWNTVMKLVDS